MIRLPRRGIRIIRIRKRLGCGSAALDSYTLECFFQKNKYSGDRSVRRKGGRGRRVGWGLSFGSP
ncbi:MAG: hypothetical protein ACYTHN_14530, partial [Planctomycetota bacterium]